MKNSLLLIVITLLAFTHCTTPPKESASGQLETLMDQYYEDRLKLFPMEATMQGDDRYNDLLPNTNTKAFANHLKGLYSKYSEELSKLDTTGFSETDLMSYKVLQWECSIGLEGLKFQSQLLPVNQFSTLHLMMGQFAGGSSMQPFNSAKDYDNWLSRLNAYVEWCDSAIANMRVGMKEGYVLPEALVVKTIPQFQAMENGPAEAHLFYMPIKNFPDSISEDDKARLTEVYASIITEKIIPINQKMAAFLQNEYLPASRKSSGIDAVPNGKAYYDYLIKLYTTTEMSADEIYALGQSEVDRLYAEMEKVKEELGFKGDLKSFFDELRTSKDLMPFTQPEQVIANFNNIHERMKPGLKKLFDKTPKTPFEVRRTEAFREASSSAEYNPGSMDGTRPGIFYVPIPNAKEYNVLMDEDLFLHEAIPGHHYQISLQQEDTTLSKFRKTLWYSAYGEGWALYSESLGKELGIYTDPYQYFGMLSAEMHRAIRLVVDAGMHTQGWTREQAIQFSMEHEAEPEASIISEIERYMAIPGQALSYKIGQLKIIELRNKAQKELGDQFDIRKFHNQILEPGCIPLELLDQKITNWIAEQKAV